MRISKKELFHLRVRTRSGMYLGVVENIILDTDAQNVVQYAIRIDWRQAKTLPFFGKKFLLTHRDQVISLNNKEMVVDDLVVPSGEKDPANKPYPNAADPAPL